ncbi:hypothetical protein SAMN04488580_11262 [Mycobacterium sp. 283mftsu]|nr:hypothetical protein MMUC44124_19850 [Mycolicibacterium mucogenicum DSM 44124]SEB22817.1 hypothetical protein SAMN04488580_11262 [Mycobacterium sp. 283mftsu]
MIVIAGSVVVLIAPAVESDATHDPSPVTPGRIHVPSTKP